MMIKGNIKNSTRAKPILRFLSKRKGKKLGNLLIGNVQMKTEVIFVAAARISYYVHIPRVIIRQPVKKFLFSHFDPLPFPNECHIVNEWMKSNAID